MTASTDMQSAELKRTFDELYEKFGKPLEQDHWGEFLVVSSRGETLLGTSLLEVTHAAAARFGPGSFAFKIGERSVGKWR